jgi:hypothetical protein
LPAKKSRINRLADTLLFALLLGFFKDVLYSQASLFFSGGRSTARKRFMVSQTKFPAACGRGLEI